MFTVIHIPTYRHRHHDQFRAGRASTLIHIAARPRIGHPLDARKCGLDKENQEKDRDRKSEGFVVVVVAVACPSRGFALGDAVLL